MKMLAVLVSFSLSVAPVLGVSPQEPRLPLRPEDRDPWDPSRAQVVVSGNVRLEGDRKNPPVSSPSTDPICAKLCKDEPPLVLTNDDGSLPSSFVWISRGLERWRFFPPEEPVLLDQVKCAFVPRILGIQVGQKLIVRNSDPTSHNVQALPRWNDPFNVMQAEQGSEREFMFKRPEAMIRLKCNMHPWMSASIGVLEHPVFAVTDAEGRFELQKLPPGEYMLSAWHELYGKVERKLELEGEGLHEVEIMLRAKSR